MQIREFFAETVRSPRRRNLASAFDEKSMNEALDDFAKEAERVEKAAAGCGAGVRIARS